jgi:hypothetical protein
MSPHIKIRYLAGVICLSLSIGFSIFAVVFPTPAEALEFSFWGARYKGASTAFAAAFLYLVASLILFRLPRTEKMALPREPPGGMLGFTPGLPVDIYEAPIYQLPFLLRVATVLMALAIVWTAIRVFLW